MSDRWAALRRACADDFVPVARDVRVLLAERDALLAALKEARGMLQVAMTSDLPGWTRQAREEMIAANPGIRIIDRALASAEGS